MWEITRKIRQSNGHMTITEEYYLYKERFRNIMEAPLFIIGGPRGGKSLTMEVLASHGEFAWISDHLNFAPNLSILSGLNRIYDIPRLGPHLYRLSVKQKDILPHPLLLPYPAETNNFFNKHLSRFGLKNRGESACHNRLPPGLRDGKDISHKEVNRLRNTIDEICWLEKKERFVSEYSLWPRMNYFSTAFPKAKFVHVVRDGRAVAYSYKEAMERPDYYEWDERDWWIRYWPREWKTEFKKNHGTVLAFCAYQWKFFLKLIWKDADRISNERYMEVKYRDLMENPKESFSKILNFGGLEMDDRMECYLRKKRLKNMNH